MSMPIDGDGPIWNGDIPIKTALAVAAVQRARSDAQIAKLKTDIDKLHRVLQTCCPTVDSLTNFLQISLDSAENTTVQDNGNSLDRLHDRISCWMMWAKAAEMLSPNDRRLLEIAQEYIFVRQLYIFQLEEDAQTARFSLQTRVACPPIEALISLLYDIIVLHFERNVSMEIKERYERMIIGWTSCLAKVCNLDDGEHAIRSWSALNDFMSALLRVECGAISLQIFIDTDPIAKRHPLHHLSEHCSMTKAAWEEGKTIRIVEDQTDGQDRQECSLDKDPCKSPISFLLSELENHAETGLFVLGCVTQLLHAYVESLVASLVTIDSNQQKQTRSEEQVFAKACQVLALKLQICLKRLPNWATNVPPDEAYLRQIANIVWDTIERSKITRQAHEDLVKQMERIGAFLIHALQSLSKQTCEP